METSEALLTAWLDMLIRVRSNRILKNMSLNEMMVCSCLVREGGERGLSITGLCHRLRLLKSQAHRVLDRLEKRGYTAQRPSLLDHRKVSVYLLPAGLEAYRREHEQLIELIDQVAENMGEERVRTLATLLDRATEIVERETVGVRVNTSGF